SEKRRSLPDSGITLVQVADVPGLFDNGTVNVPQALQDRFPNWVSELRKRQISADFDLRDRASASIDRALAALCRDSLDSVWSLDWTSAAPEDGSSPDDDEKNDADDADDSPQVSENYKKAVEKIEKLLEENPDEIDRARILNAYYMEMGGWAEAEGELEDAKEYYEKALGTNAHILSLQPDDPEAWYDSCIASSALGVLWEAEGDRVQARKKLRNGAENSDKNCRGKFGRS
ncbi:MAG: hypothetical protein GX293_13740, partial [Bacteroidales bacterium]|nr:hypothetical protein [Bacteroidales bacterium]